MLRQCQLVFFTRCCRGRDPLDAAGIGQHAAEWSGNAEWPLSKSTRHDVRELVTEDWMRKTIELDVHLVSPGLGDVGGGCPHQSTFLCRRLEHECHDAIRKLHVEP